MKKDINYQVQDIPAIIQKVLLKYGAKKKLTSQGYLRYFKLGTIRQLKQYLQPNELYFLIDHSNSYIVQSKDEKTIITMGTYLNH